VTSSPAFRRHLRRIIEGPGVGLVWVSPADWKAHLEGHEPEAFGTWTAPVEGDRSTLRARVYVDGRIVGVLAVDLLPVGSARVDMDLGRGTTFLPVVVPSRFEREIV
jgi:hypothetical protein